MSNKAGRGTLLLVLLFSQCLAAEGQWQGQPLRDYILFLAQRDLEVIFSSDLVRPEYTVIDEPEPAAEPSAALAAALQPYGLALRDGPGDSVLVVTAGGAAVAAPSAGVAEADAAADELPLPEIVVTSSVYQLSYEPTGSHTFLDRDLTTRLPDLGDDAVRAIVRLPGSTNGGVSTRSHVRGGVENEQLFLFDGLRLYEPYHLKDFRSVATIIEQGVIGGIDFYSAGYQARHGDRMSGVIDISLRDPPVDTTTELSLSFFNASALSMGRFGGSNRGDWLVSGRRGNLDLIAEAIDSDYGSPRYEDALLHFGWELGDRTYISGNALMSYDKISLQETDESAQANAKYRNRVAWFKAETDWSPRMFSETILSATEIDNTRIGVVEVPGVVAGNVEETRDFKSLSLTQRWRMNVSDNWSVTTGFDAKRLEAVYLYASSLDIAPPFDQLVDNEPSQSRDIDVAPRGGQYALYVESRWRVFDKLIIDAGVRWDQQSYTTANDDDQVSPRLNLLYPLGERTELRLGFGHFYQAQEINELQVADGESQFHPAQRAQHRVASLNHVLTSGIDLRLEVYEKKYRSLMPRYENAFDPLALIPELQIDRVRIDADSAVSRGAELMINGEHRQKNLLWWLSYAWSETKDVIAGVHIKRSWDETHAVKGGINWDWRQWSFSAAGQVHTGWPRTDLQLETVADPAGAEQLFASTTPRNALRHSVFHSLDVRASRKFSVGKGELTGFIEITNLYNRENACCTTYTIEQDAGGEDVLVTDPGYWLPLVPSLGVIWRF